MPWYRTRDRRLYGPKFRRQHPIGKYTADFVCLGHVRIVEVDGGQHGAPRDAKRDAVLTGAGFRVLRFWNDQVIGEMEVLLQTIASAAGAPHPTLSPQPGRGKEDASHRNQNSQR